MLGWGCDATKTENISGELQVKRYPTGQWGDILLTNCVWCPFSIMIRARTGSDWSHVARFIGPETLIECLPSGVVITESTKYAGEQWRVRRRTYGFTPDQVAKGQDFVSETLHHGYDWKGVCFGFLPFGKLHWQNKDKWFCSEWNTAFDELTGHPVASDSYASCQPPKLYAETPLYETIRWNLRKPVGWGDKPNP